jgi:hypothetical protein
MARSLTLHSAQRPVNQKFSNHESSTSPRHTISAGSLEWKLLLAATTASPPQSDRIRSLLNTKNDRYVDWQSLIRSADFHGTSSLLYQNLNSLADAVPGEVLESLRQRYLTNVQKSLFLARELTRILDCAHALGIELISYKGFVLSEICYGDMAMRQAGDIDLFVRKRDLIRTKSALRELGYAPSQDIPEDSEKDYIASGYEYCFDSPAGKHLLELQWALQPRYYAVDYDMDGLFARAVEVTAAGFRMKIPSPEDLLLVLCVHSAKHAWGRVIWLRDIAQILQRHDLNFDSILSRAHELGIMRILHVTFLLANRFLEMPLPAEIEPAIRADYAAHAFAEEVAPSIIAGISWEDHKMSYFRLMMRLRERRSDQLRFLTRLTFTPGPGEWQALKLPRALSPLYRAVRMARLAARFSR